MQMLLSQKKVYAIYSGIMEFTKKKKMQRQEIRFKDKAIEN